MGNSVKKQMALGVVFSYLLIIMKLLVGIVYTPIILRLLGPSEYGVYSLTVSIVGYLTILDAGANAAYIRFYVQAKTNDLNKSYSLNMFFLLFFISFAIIASILCFFISMKSTFIFGKKISSDEYYLIQKCLNWLAISIFFEVSGSLWRSMIIANEKFAFGKLLNLLVYISVPIISIPLLIKGYDCSCILLIRVIIRAVEFFIEMFFCLFILHEKFSFKGIDKQLFLIILNFIGFIVIQSIMDQLNWQVDKFILSHTHGTQEISLYSIGTTFNNIYMTISASLAGVFIAEANKLVAQNKSEELNDLFIKTSRLCTYVVVIIMLEYSLFGHSFVCRWAGDNYSKSYLVGFLLMFPLTFSLCLGMGQDITRAKNKHRLQVLLDFAVCVINTFLSIPLALKWGAVGCAIGTFFSELILCCIIQPIYYQKVVGLNMKLTFKKISEVLKGCIIPILYGICIRLFGVNTHTYKTMLLHGGIVLFLYGISIYFFSFNDYEKNLIKYNCLKWRKKNDF